MATYTYDDIRRKLAESNLQFSDADMKLAEKNPDAGMSLINYKLDYDKATTDEMRALANQGAESIRSSIGGYSGGNDGSQYYLTKPTPSSFSEEATPSYKNKYADSISGSINKMQNQGSFSYNQKTPSYYDAYEYQRGQLIDTIANPDPFSYDKNSDDSYKAYAKQYAREGKRATEDTLAAASAASGGIASSYALTAAQQSGNYYASQLSDKIPELYENAYSRYLQQYQQKQNALTAVQGESQNEYDKYLNELNQYNTNRNFAYNQYSDEYNRSAGNLSAASALEQLDYSKYLNDQSQSNNDRNFRYQQILDTVANNQYGDERQYSRAKDAAGYRDYSFLNKLGVNTAKQEEQDTLSNDYNKLQIGAQHANYGSYDYLDSLGVDTSSARNALNQSNYASGLEAQLLEQQIENAKTSRNDNAYSRQLEYAKLAAAQGDFSALRSLGINTTDAEKAYGASLNSNVDTASNDAKLMKASRDYNSGKATEEQIDILISAGLVDPSALFKTASGTKPASTIPYNNAIDSAPIDNYSDINDRMLSRNEWQSLKMKGIKASAVSSFDTYDKYVATYNDYLKGN